MEKYQEDLLHRHSLDMLTNLDVDKILMALRVRELIVEHDMKLIHDMKAPEKWRQIINLLKRLRSADAFWVFCHEIRSQSNELFCALHQNQGGNSDTCCPECKNDEMGSNKIIINAELIMKLSKQNVVLKKPEDILIHIKDINEKNETLKDENKLLHGYIKSLNENLNTHPNWEDQVKLQDSLLECQKQRDAFKSDLGEAKDALEAQTSELLTAKEMLNRRTLKLTETIEMLENMKSELSQAKEMLKKTESKNDTLFDQIFTLKDENKKLSDKYNDVLTEKRQVEKELQYVLHERERIMSDIDGNTLPANETPNMPVESYERFDKIRPPFKVNSCSSFCQFTNTPPNNSSASTLPRKNFKDGRSQSIDSGLTDLAENKPPPYTRAMRADSDIEKKSSYVDSMESHSRREVTLTKQNNGLGLEIIGGNKVGILISKVKPSSAASNCGLVKGMRILKVNGIDLENIAFCYVHELFKKFEKGNHVTFIVQNMPYDEYERLLEKKPYDYFHIRTIKKYIAKDADELSFQPGETLCITSTYVVTENKKSYKWKATKPHVVDTYQTSGNIPRQLSSRSPSSIEDHDYENIDRIMETNNQKYVGKFYLILDPVGEQLV
ncbi:tight junction protein ZO-1-like [Hydractinia symbiolongicarpus]|uniref:tight junction protein ZO-1-like n=1 Tax=Hydractinia symbiolongicarpus TaxID=13093 RepID=UPI002551ADC3|nr:tight junction protein ZO-1-like [Hydractinia symbiolongicarpus]